MRKVTINILGGGPVGSLLSLMLVQKGYEVKVFEKRGDPRQELIYEGRSINLALSHRGIQALKYAGIFHCLKDELIPMEGRMMHSADGELTFQPYGKEGQAINSISRARLNEVLCIEAEKAGVEFFFDHKCIDVNLSQNRIQVKNEDIVRTFESDFLFGADGAFSVLRKEYEKDIAYKSTVLRLSYGYKELNITPKNGDFTFDPNYLHIWPRGDFMLIALPNPEKSFTCTLFLALEGENSFERLTSTGEIEVFFRNNFADVFEQTPDIVDQFKTNPTSNLNIVDCFPWSKGESLVIGDAAHAILPFYGQGMNAGFEDCRVLMKMLEKYNFDWPSVLMDFEKSRKPDTDAISSLALKNFVEMRDKVSHKDFLNRKKLEARLQTEYPESWMPLYSMVTFTDIPYSECLKLGKLQQDVLDQVNDFTDPSSIDLKPIIELFNDLVRADQQACL